VVHRGRGVPTLSSVVQAEEPLLPARLRPAKEKQNQDSKAEERGEPIAAGRPSNWEDSRRSSYAGRRSRRNSVSDDSQVNACCWRVVETSDNICDSIKLHL
jgi:calmodulin-regulated spectrin-associated protein